MAPVHTPSWPMPRCKKPPILPCAYAFAAASSTRRIVSIWRYSSQRSCRSDAVAFSSRCRFTPRNIATKWVGVEVLTLSMLARRNERDLADDARARIGRERDATDDERGRVDGLAHVLPRIAEVDEDLVPAAGRQVVRLM